MHAHLLITTRRTEGDQLAAKKARDLDPEVRKAGARTLVTDAEAWGETWRAHQDRYLQKHLGVGPDGTPDPATIQNIADAKQAVLGQRDALVLYDRDTGEAVVRFTTDTVREQERAALADGAAVAGAGHHRGVTARHQEAALASRTLRDDQRGV